ncbi:YjgP/YjgQ family permease [Balneolaceae bacterium YR4-1]|uniref:YjgP/YjgQ family permease n=1 Tax=Halalkalibaculum roseum TaxID=2709311 RepID=A0A6M1SX89_9BACT|nr:YjgP/YjgQ family permease [Halalkalibaculum roseum]
MRNKIDRYIFIRLFAITIFVLGVLIFIFLVIDFSNNSDDFTDRGATFIEIFGDYYLNYIPEIIRLVIPVAIFVACLYLTGQMTDRLEITALKAAGVSLYRLIVPYLLFGFIMLVIISYLDGFIIPDSNSKRIAFENRYLKDKTEKVDRNRIYRQESENTIFEIRTFDANQKIGYNIEVIEFEGDSIKKMMKIQRMEWIPNDSLWKYTDIEEKTFTPTGYVDEYSDSMRVALNILPRDLARTTSDIYQLTYREAYNYIQSIKRSGASNTELPQVQFYGRLAYPFSIIVSILVGFAIASVRRRGGRGFHIAAGLTISFLYLALMKVIEPFGGQGALDPVIAATLPHVFFLFVGLVLLFAARK